MKYKTVKYGDPLLIEFCKLVHAAEVDKEYKFWFTEDRMSKKFHNVELCLVDNIPISFSGCSIVDNKLRVSQQHYTLPMNRQQFRDLLIRPNGFIDRHFITARSLGIDTLLVTMHSFNKKTETVVKLYDKRRKHYRHLKDLIYTGIHKISYVPQHCYEMKI